MDSIADKSISVRQQCFESFDVSMIIINLPLILLARRVTCSQKMAIIYEYVYQCFKLWLRGFDFVDSKTLIYIVENCR